MSGSIRQYIKRRVWWCAAVALGGWLMIPLGGAIARNLPDGFMRIVLPVVGFVMFGGAILALQWAVRCPKCTAKLGRTVAMPIAFSWGSGPKINFCPYCGVNLDEPLPDAHTAAESLNPIK
jgi:hypothetical protein